MVTKKDVEQAQDDILNKKGQNGQKSTNNILGYAAILGLVVLAVIASQFV